MRALLVILLITFVQASYACESGHDDRHNYLYLASVDTVEDVCTSFTVILLNEDPNSPGRVISNVYLQVLAKEENVTSSSELSLQVNDDYSHASFCVDPEFIGTSRLDVWTREKLEITIEEQMVTTTQSGSLCNEPIEIGLSVLVEASKKEQIKANRG